MATTSLTLTLKDWYRFWSNVEKTAACWIWTGKRSSRDYGLFSVNSQWHSAHRLSFVSTGGEIAPGMELDHLCRVHSCVRPSHLQAVPHQVNAQRGDAGSYLKTKTHCKRGHPLAGANLLNPERAHPRNRRCRQCHHLHTRTWRDKQRNG